MNKKKNNAMRTLAERRWLFEKINNKTDQVIRNKVIYKYKKWKKGITIFHGNTKIFMSKNMHEMEIKNYFGIQDVQTYISRYRI